MIKMDAKMFGFSPKASGKDNAFSLNKAISEAKEIYITVPGVYDISDTVCVL